LNRGIYPRASTADFLKQALEKGGVEFLAADGVRLREEVLEIYTYEGQKALPCFMVGRI
jgi:hypothetical protein